MQHGNGWLARRRFERRGAACRNAKRMDALTWRVLMKPTIALLRVVQCRVRRSPRAGRAAHRPAPTGPTVPTVPTDQVDGGVWGQRAPLIEPNSELAFAELNGKLYLLGGYPASRQTARTVQVYDIASGSWQLGPPLPQPNNHGMAAGVNGKVYLIGGQTMADAPSLRGHGLRTGSRDGCMGREGADAHGAQLRGGRRARRQDLRRRWTPAARKRLRRLRPEGR